MKVFKNCAQRCWRRTRGYDLGVVARRCWLSTVFLLPAEPTYCALFLLVISTGGDRESLADKQLPTQRNTLASITRDFLLLGLVFPL